jgi:hypothetical protein
VNRGRANGQQAHIHSSRGRFDPRCERICFCGHAEEKASAAATACAGLKLDGMVCRRQRRLWLG